MTSTCVKTAPKDVYRTLVDCVKADYRRVAKMMLSGDQYSDPFMQGGVDFLAGSFEGRVVEIQYPEQTPEYDAYRYGWNTVSSIYTSLYLACGQDRNEMLEKIVAGM